MAHNKDITQFEYCYGCGVCTMACPVGIITLKNENGFYKPTICDLSKCIHCGLCLKSCAFNDRSPLSSGNPITSFASWSKDPSVRMQSSSGGVSYEIGKRMIAGGYSFVGVKYNPENGRAEHYIAESLDELKYSIGSKYIQSYTFDALRKITINRDKKYAVVGTPCQIDSLRRYIKTKNLEESFLLIDFFCHGVPSSLLWDKYLQKVEKKTGKGCSVSWRNKDDGWHAAYVMTANDGNTGAKYKSKNTEGDIFYHMFFHHYCLGKQCLYDCKYKNLSSAADIRIGDLWGNKYKNDNNGVSGVLCLTEKGRIVFDELDTIERIVETPDVVTEFQLKKNPKPGRYASLCKRLLSSQLSIDAIRLLIYSFEFKDRVLSKLFRK